MSKCPIKINAFTMLGDRQSEENIKRIEDYIDDPTPDKWSDVCGIIIIDGRTLWQCVVLIDYDFPRTGRRMDMEGNTIKEWERIPTSFQVLRAIDNVNKIFQKRGEL